MEVCTFYHMDFQLFQNCLLKYDQYDLLLESLQWFPLLLEENPQSFCMICKAFCSCACLVLPSHFVPHAFLSILLQPHWPSSLCEFPKLFSNAVLVCTLMSSTWNTLQLCCHMLGMVLSQVHFEFSFHGTLPFYFVMLFAACKNYSYLWTLCSLCGFPMKLYAPWGCILHVQHCACPHKTYCLVWMEMNK